MHADYSLIAFHVYPDSTYSETCIPIIISAAIMNRLSSAFRNKPHVHLTNKTSCTRPDLGWSYL